MAAQSNALAPETGLEPLDAVPEAAPGEHPLARLQAVHDEAKETSELANLLGRTLYAGLLLPLLVIVTVVFSDPPLMRVLSFSVLVLMGAGVLLYVHVKAMRSPFDHESLRALSGDLDAILLYTGFAWGAGAFLILPAGSDPAFATLFSGCTAAIVAMIVRKREAVLMFAAPTGLLTALAALLRPLELPFITAALTAMASFVVIGSVALSSWMKERHSETVAVTDIQPA